MLPEYVHRYLQEFGGTSEEARNERKIVSKSRTEKINETFTFKE